MKKIQSIDDALNAPLVIVAVVVVAFYASGAWHLIMGGTFPLYVISAGVLEFTKAFGLGVVGFLTGVVLANLVIRGEVPGERSLTSRWSRRH